MIDVRKIEVQSIEELILALHPVQSSAINSNRLDAAIAELRQMKSNITAVLSFTSHSAVVGYGKRSRASARHRRSAPRVSADQWNDLANHVPPALVVLREQDRGRLRRMAHYEDMASAACRMCLIFAPELGNNLLSAF